MAKDKKKQETATSIPQPMNAHVIDRSAAAQPRYVQASNGGTSAPMGAGGTAVPPNVGAGQMPTGRVPQMPNKQGGNKRTIIIVLVCVVVAIAVWLCIWLFACNGSSLFDPSAQDGQAPYKTQEEMQAELDRVVEEGMFNISIAGVIQFDEGTSEGTAYIENVPGNHYNMKVSIADDDTGEVLYESGVLKPNQFIEKIALTKDLEAGSYPATATFTALDPTTHDEIGQAAAKVTINVLE